MLPVRIKKFSGLYTNYDPNDLSLEVFEQSDNFKHTKGKLTSIPEHLTSGSLPNVDLFHNETEGTWSLERYVITDIVSDPIPRDIKVVSYRIHFVIYKRSYVESGKTYYVRSCWFREESDFTWYELSSDGNYNTSSHPIHIKGFNPLQTDPAERYGDCFFTTDIDGKAFVFDSEGALRIYMPHDCFWFGRISRTQKFIYTSTTTSGYYFDRILEPYHNGISLINGTFPNFTTGPNCRASINFPYTIVTSGLIIADATPLTYALPSRDYSLRMYIPGYVTPKDVLTHAWDGVRDSKGNNIPWLVAPINRAFMLGLSDNNVHLAFKLSATLVAFHSEYFDDITVKNKSDGSIVDISGRYYPGIIIEYGGTSTPYTNPNGGGFYYFSISEIDDQTFIFEYAGTKTIADVGFDPVYVKAYLIFTAQFDNREEIVISKRLIDINNGGYPWALMLDTPQVPANNNKRITRYFIYLKFDKEADYEQMKEYIVEEDGIYEVFNSFISTEDQTGKYLSQTIGFTFTEEKDDYEIENKFSDFIINNGFGYALYSNDQLNVYHSAYGRGKIMPDLFYPNNKIDIKGMSFVKKLISVGPHLGLLTNAKTELIQTQASEGSLIFDTFDTLPFGIDDREHALQVQGGAIIKTREGIFFTDGYQIRDRISEPINNLVKESSGNIYYNPIKHELYWIYSNDPMKYGRYRFDEKVWEIVYKHQTTNLQGIVIDPDGTVNLFTPNEIYLEDLESLEFEGYLKTGASDLGHSEIDKILDEVIIDSKGFINIFVYGDDKLIDVFASSDSGTRHSEKIFYPLANRFPFAKMYLEITSADVDFELYDITLMVDTLPRKQNG